MLKPKALLRLEGAAALIAACVFYHAARGSWLWFALLLLVPDISMAGYAVNKKLGTALYNTVHTYTGPLLALSLLRLSGQTSCEWLALIWLAHIGMDRMLGFGLKYDTDFKDTHLHRLQ